MIKAVHKNLLCLSIVIEMDHMLSKAAKQNMAPQAFE